MTIPAMIITIFVMLSHLVVATLGKKNDPTGIGVDSNIRSGIFFTKQFVVALMCRLLLGVGIGLYNSLSISIISDYYEGDERASMIGFRTATLNIGKALTTFIVGLALLVGVNYTYLVYLLVIPVYILFSKYVPEIDTSHLTLKKTTYIDQAVGYLMLITFFVGISYIGATIKIPSLLVNKYHYSSFYASNMLTILAISGILIGLVFGQLTKYLNDSIMAVMILLMGLGNLIFTFATHSALFILGAL